MARAPESAQEVSTRLRATGYLPDEGLSTITYLALAMQRPLLLEGEPGTGKDRPGRGAGHLASFAELLKVVAHV